jgi:hypothetical protein
VEPAATTEAACVFLFFPEAWVAWRGAGEGALKPRSDHVSWIVVKPTGKAYEPLILIVLVYCVHKLGYIKRNPSLWGTQTWVDIGLFALFLYSIDMLSVIF